MEIVEINSLSQLQSYESAWNELLEQCTDPSPSQSFAWVHAYLGHKLDPAARWVCLFAFDGQEPIGVLTVISRIRLGIARFAIQLFEIPYDPFHTYRTDALIRPGYEQVIDDFVRRLRQSFRALPIVRMQSITELGSSCIARQKGCQRLRFVRIASGAEEVVTLSGDFQDYNAGLRSKFRREMKRQQRKIEGHGAVVYRMNDQQQTNHDQFLQFTSIENSGWKGSRGTSIYAHRGDFELFSEATEKFAANGWMEWNFLDVGQETVAAQLAVRIRQTLYLWKVGYLEDYCNCAPGNLLLYHLIAESYRLRELSELNFMNDPQWLREFKPLRRQLYDLLICPRLPGIALLLRAALYLKDIKRKLKLSGRRKTV